ncbi:MAG: FIST C-terminal domain-containing protein [Thermoleophilaceae bacterium]|nr:FIST C-terminal domain-containing protein [Thermoleophilaceae bacterium]
MAVRIATGLSAADAGVDSFAEAAGRAALGLGGARADVAVVFAGAPNLAHVEQGLDAVRDRLGAHAALMGCGAQGVVASGRELESGGVAVWAASMPGVAVEPFQLDAVPTGEGEMAVAGLPDFDGVEAAVMIADPYTFPVEPLLDRLSEDEPGLRIVGGLASAGEEPGTTTLFHSGGVERGGALGFTLAGVDVHTCVSQGARPIGPEMVVTACEGNVIHELASRPALLRLQEAIEDLDPLERALAARGLLLGIVIDENKPEYERGDFLIRQIVGADESEATVVVSERVRVGQTVRLQVRDGESADEDLRQVLEAELTRLGRPPAGALLFTCNGRGSQMFTEPDHDAAAVELALGGAPAAGFFCAGEIGPVGKRNFVHGFTATLAVFPDG